MRTKYIDDAKSLNIASAMPHTSRGVWLLMLETGVRISDALEAKNKDFDSKGFFHYTAQKTGKKGRAKVSKNFIAEYVNRDFPDEYVFASTNHKRLGKPITRQTVFLHIKRACLMCGYDDIGIAPHSARKHFAVDLFRDEGLGVTMNALQHRDASTTFLYAMSDNPLTELNKRVRRVEKSVEKLDQKIEYLFDEIFGDDRYSIAKKG